MIGKGCLTRIGHVLVVGDQERVRVETGHYGVVEGGAGCKNHSFRGGVIPNNYEYDLQARVGGVRQAGKLGLFRAIAIANV